MRGNADETNAHPHRGIPRALRTAAHRRNDAVITVGIIKDGQVSYTVYGENGAVLPAEPHTYEIGSLTKTFTAALINKAIREEELDFDDTIDQYLTLPAGNAYPTIQWDWQADDAYLPAGGITSNIEDMLQYAKYQLDGDVRFSNCHKSLKTIHASTESYEAMGVYVDEIGMAWIIDRENGVVWHNGGTGDYNSYLGFSPETAPRGRCAFQSSAERSHPRHRAGGEAAGGVGGPVRTAANGQFMKTLRAIWRGAFFLC